MRKVDYKGIRAAWLRDMRAEAKLWLAHIDEKAKRIVEIRKEGRVPIFEEAELLFNISSFLNWLAHIDLREDHYIKENGHSEGRDIITWLEGVTSWPRSVCEAFWYCVRNPVMHTGRSDAFSDYDRKSGEGSKLFAGFNPNPNFDPLRFQPKEFKPTPDQDGHLALPSPLKENVLEVNFYFAGVRRKLDIALGLTLKNIETASDSSLAGLERVNRKILAFRVVGEDQSQSQSQS